MHRLEQASIVWPEHTPSHGNRFVVPPQRLFEIALKLNHVRQFPLRRHCAFILRAPILAAPIEHLLLSFPRSHDVPLTTQRERQLLNKSLSAVVVLAVHVARARESLL